MVYRGDGLMRADDWHRRKNTHVTCNISSPADADAANLLRRQRLIKSKIPVALPVV